MRETERKEKYLKLLQEDPLGNRLACYKLYMESLVWQKRREEVVLRDKGRCRTCWNSKEDGMRLEVHHAFYVDNLFDDDLVENGYHVTLCVECHDLHTNRDRGRKYGLRPFTPPKYVIDVVRTLRYEEKEKDFSVQVYKEPY